LTTAASATLVLASWACATGTALAQEDTRQGRPDQIELPRARSSIATLRPAVGTGHLARTASVNDTSHMHLLKAFGSVLLEEGAATGTLPGQAKVRLIVGSTVTASFSIRTRMGTIYGSGRAALHSSGRYASFGGSLSVSRGSGRYAHASGGGRLYGVIDRRTSGLTVQAIGTLSY
jgi:hypothetical protein